MSEIRVNKNFDYNKYVSSTLYEKYASCIDYDNESIFDKEFNIDEKPELENKALDIKNRIDELDKKINIEDKDSH